MRIDELDQLIKTVAPISGICIDPRRIDFLPEATQAERDAAEAIMDANIALVDDNAPEPIVLTALQFLRGLSELVLPPRTEPFITPLEARNRAVIPTALAAVFNALPEAQKNAAEITWANMTKVSRNEPLVFAAQAALGLSSAEVDYFFAIAVQL
jgi:hypothetical protein